MTVGQIVHIVRTDEPDDPRGSFEMRTAQYLYAFSTPQGQEILSFHWSPQAIGSNVVTTPHLHIGPAITAGQSALRPGDLHKAHIPTGSISVEAVVRLAIAEFSVQPLRPNWEEVLQQTEGIFIPT